MRDLSTVRSALEERLGRIADAVHIIFADQLAEVGDELARFGGRRAVVRDASPRCDSAEAVAARERLRRPGGRTTTHRIAAAAVDGDGGFGLAAVASRGGQECGRGAWRILP